MKLWKVTYQAVPYAHTAPAVLLIEAASAVEAFAVAYNTLTLRGMAVYVDNGLPSALRTTEPKKEFGRAQDLKAMGVLPTAGNVHIRSIVEHNVTAQGRVVEA